MSRRTKRAGAEAEGRREVDPGELLNGGAESNYWFFDPLAPSLPLWQMGWLDFEKLCTQLIKACDNDVLQAFRYGALQQGQGGIDILAVRRSTQKKLVLECKCVRKLRPVEIARCIDRLLSRADLSEIDQWILCVTVDVQRNKHLLEEWHKAVNRLRPLHIEPLIWGLRELDERLRVQPEVVSRFFGAEVAARFCGKVVLQNEWPTAYHRQRVSDRAIENYSVKLDVFWPKERSSGVSAAFYFSRADLSGISLAIDGATLVRWMQWAAHAGPGQEIPFIPAAPRESKFVLMAPTARLQLQRSEVEDLRWVLREAWTKYIEAAQTVDEAWRASRFPVRQRRSEDVSFVLCKVEPWFWRAVLAYAAEHDFSKGDSPEYIFEGGTGCLKVYVGQPRAGLQPGYHLVAYGFGDEAHTFSDAGVVIVWQPFPELGGQAPVYSRDRAWDAEYTHGWLMGTLFPAVLNWLRTQERRQVSPFSRWRERLTRTLSGSRSREVQISEVAISCARTPRAWVALQFGTRDEALQLVRGLQAHFNGYDCLAPLEVSLERRVLDLVLYLLSGTERDDERYIRGKLDIEAGKSLSQGLQALIAKRTAGTVTGWGLDMALRSLIAALETAPELEVARLDYVARQLEPLWKRWREDLLCWAYC